MSSFSNYIVYVDESGDHGLVDVDPTYPVFVLAFCIFEKPEYIDTVTPAVQRLKFEWFGHDQIILHEREIRKARGCFKFLVDQEERTTFLSEITGLIVDSPFTLIATVVRKDLLTETYTRPWDPYRIGMTFCLERLYKFLESRDAVDATTFVVAEQRGKKEDNLLELEFRRICSGRNYRNEKFPFELVLSPKWINSCGLQFADLMARPIGLHVLRPAQTNRAYTAIEGKFDRSESGTVDGYGLKVFP